MTTRFLGNCQYCEADQKLNNGVLVHHGFTRPGDGAIHGDCLGVSEAPYETSCELLKKVLPGIQKHLGSAVAWQTKLADGEVTHLSGIKQTWNGFETYEYSVGVTEPYTMSQALQSAKWDADSKVRMLTSEVARIEKRIASWKPLPIRTIEEEQAKKDALSAAKKAEKAAKKAAKEAKAAALQAKRDALAAKRAAILADFSKKFHALADGLTEENKEETLKAARALANSTKAQKYSWFYTQELQCDEIFIKLGLAVREEDRWVSYKF